MGAKLNAQPKSLVDAGHGSREVGNERDQRGPPPSPLLSKSGMSLSQPRTGPPQHAEVFQVPLHQRETRGISVTKVMDKLKLVFY